MVNSKTLSKMYKKAVLIFIFLLCFQHVRSQDNEKVIIDRIEYIFNLRPFIAKNYWKNFDKSKYEVPLIYYTDSASYIANPKKDFVSYFKPKLIFRNNKIKIYKTQKRFDDIPFHMETSSSYGESIDLVLQPNPIMNCSSLEVTAKKIPETTSTEYWATMVIHEYFHGFQYNHKPFLDEFLKVAAISEDSLALICKNNSWVKLKILNENTLLLKAIQAKNQIETNKYIDSFFVSRKERRLDIQQKLKVDITDCEKIYETMEGTARYIEYCLQVAYATKIPDKNLLQFDSQYKSYKVFENYTMEKDSYLYTASNRYFYATGFNILRLLDKLNIEYKLRLFNEKNLSLDELLELNYKKIMNN